MLAKNQRISRSSSSQSDQLKPLEIGVRNVESQGLPLTNVDEEVEPVVHSCGRRCWVDNDALAVRLGTNVHALHGHLLGHHGGDIWLEAACACAHHDYA